MKTRCITTISCTGVDVYKMLEDAGGSEAELTGKFDFGKLYDLTEVAKASQGGDPRSLPNVEYVATYEVTANGFMITVLSEAPFSTGPFRDYLRYCRFREDISVIMLTLLREAHYMYLETITDSYDVKGIEGDAAVIREVFRALDYAQLEGVAQDMAAMVMQELTQPGLLRRVLPQPITVDEDGNPIEE